MNNHSEMIICQTQDSSVWNAVIRKQEAGYCFLLFQIGSASLICLFHVRMFFHGAA